MIDRNSNSNNTAVGIGPLDLEITTGCVGGCTWIFEPLNPKSPVSFHIGGSVVGAPHGFERGTGIFTEYKRLYTWD